jgi:phosphoribosylformylglycinamidine synthase
LQLLSSPTIASKAWVYRQYDQSVRTNTVVGPGAADAAVVRLRGTRKALALKTDCNARYVYLDPRVGGRIAVAESARNVACVGARPMAITNCVNFGIPKRPEVFYQFREAVGGMGDACTALGTPVTGGNVSFYNESPAGAVFPTPTIGMVGLIEDLGHVTRATFRQDGDTVILLGEPTAELGASEYLARIHDVTAGRPPACDLDGERHLIDALLDAIRAGLIHSAHDCSDGGLAVALAECCMMERHASLGAEIDLSAWNQVPARALLYGEAQGRVIVSSSAPAKVLAVAERFSVPARVIGRVTAAENASLRIRMADRSVDVAVSELAAAYHDTIPAIMTQVAIASDDSAMSVTGERS